MPDNYFLFAGAGVAVVAALIAVANIQGLKQIARFYIWIFRGTPLLVQLFVVFFGLSRVGIVWIRFRCSHRLFFK
ncbi:MAG: ABC transporter permease subunit [Gallintestinimicrobium sp.]